ncbi:MAG: PAC2 family protein [Candidatus Omnitrophica bacterium]|nr:PAC2 family protein [Candidatus Omnitrophota bacterium]
MERIKFSRKPRLKNPYLIVAWPGMGEVAFKAASFLLDKLKAEEFAEILANEFFYLSESVVQDGILSLPEMPFNKFYFAKLKNAKNDLIIFLSDAQPDLTKAEEYCNSIIALAKKYKVKEVISFAAMPQPVDHSQQPGVWFTSTSIPINERLKSLDLRPLTDGQISGLNGLFLGLAKKAGFGGFCLLGEIPLYTIQIENPKASFAVLESLKKVIAFEVDLSELLDQAHVMEEQINSLLDHLKSGPTPGPIGEEEIEKIKKTLSQLTKLPLSVKEKIEKMFIQANSDIAKAHELKSELDKWSVYKEYEDRFLDLFKKAKNQNN